MEYILNIINSFEFQALFKLVLGFILAGIIGLERSSWSKPAGFRTHALVGLSAVLIMLCGEYLSRVYDMDPSRIPAQLLSGIGFIGAGTIMFQKHVVRGLTTAAGIWSTGAIGLASGAGMYWVSVISTLLTLATLELLSLFFKKYGLHSTNITFSTKDNEVVKLITDELTAKKFLIINYETEHRRYENIDIYKISITIKSHKMQMDNTIIQILQSHKEITIDSVEN